MTLLVGEVKRAENKIYWLLHKNTALCEVHESKWLLNLKHGFVEFFLMEVSFLSFTRQTRTLMKLHPFLKKFKVKSQPFRHESNFG